MARSTPGVFLVYRIRPLCHGAWQYKIGLSGGLKIVLTEKR